MFYSRVLQCHVQILEEAEMIQIGTQYFSGIKKNLSNYSNIMVF